MSKTSSIEQDGQTFDDSMATAGARPSLRRQTFLFQDGMVIAATLRAMDAVGLLARSEERSNIAELCPNLTETGFAHVRVGLRTLAQAGWIKLDLGLLPETTTVEWTRDGKAVAGHFDKYLRLAEYLATFDDSSRDLWIKPWPKARLALFDELIDLASARWKTEDLDPPLREVVLAHLDGALASPALLWLEANDGLESPVFRQDSAGARMARLLVVLGWALPDGSWTPWGLRARSFVTHLGLAGSYLPLFSRLPELYSGMQPGPFTRLDGAREWHVHRELNIRASTVAHTRYFQDADALIARAFNRPPLDRQPRFVLDVGCGDGSWLARIHRLVRDNTLRGKFLERSPLTLIGIDASRVAVEKTEATLTAVGAKHLSLMGDVGDPQKIAELLAEHGYSMADALNIRSFVDHDRGYRAADLTAPTARSLRGAFIDDQGRALSNDAIIPDLAAHFRRWAPYVGRHGLITLEAHAVEPRIAARYPGELHSLSFDAYHGYSRQYPIDRKAYVSALRQGGFRLAATGQRYYPNSLPFVAVSLNHLVSGDEKNLIAGDDDGSSSRGDTWQPDENVDLVDGRALHALLYEDGMLQPRSWCAPATSTLISAVVQEIEQRVAGLSSGDILRVCDYGTGTGLAAIELLKACRELGIEEMLSQRNVQLEIHLVDVPSSWFAYCYQLLSSCSWTRFHSLTGPDGRFLALPEVTGGLKMDIIVSSMVFHLIPPGALSRLGAGLAAISRPDARLLWNSPDLGPEQPYALSFHHPNRLLRKYWKDLLAGRAHPETAEQRAAVAAVGEGGADQTSMWEERANRRILPRLNLVNQVAEALASHFKGETYNRIHEMLDSETIGTLMIPSNQEEYLPEVEDAVVRTKLIEDLMSRKVLPEIGESAAGTDDGFNVLWTFGSFNRR